MPTSAVLFELRVIVLSFIDKKLLGRGIPAPVFALCKLIVYGPQNVPSLLPHNFATEFSVVKRVKLAGGPSVKTLRVI